MSGEAISALPSATTPLSGAEIIPLVQSGVTRQVSVANVAAAATAPVLAYTIVNGGIFSVVGGRRYGVVTSVGASTVSLPTVASNLSGGLAIELRDLSLDANANHIVINAAGLDRIVLGATTATNQTISVNGAIVVLIPYAANRWRAMLTASA